MFLDLRRLFCEDGTLPISAEFDLSDTEFSGVFPIKTPVKITGEILSRTGIVSLNAEISYAYSADCDRCGTPATRQYRFKYGKTLVTSLANGVEDDDVIVLKDMKFDLYDFVRTEVILSIPSKHLCREDCKGICPKCGKNLNEGKCDCKSDNIDPRLQILQQLLTDE